MVYRRIDGELKIRFTVAFTGAVDREGLPITTVIYINVDEADVFEEYLRKEIGNTVMYAERMGNIIE